MYFVYRHPPRVPDHRGTYISVPVAHFNGIGGWKKQFEYPKRTYVVSIVEISNATPGVHEVCFLGVESTTEERFHINEEAYTKFRKMWLDHGKRMVPAYVLHPPGAGDVVEDGDAATTPRETKRTSAQGAFPLILYKRHNTMYAC
jgi:hypothetical protein